jgi:glycerol-1-phosphate dehydrogenase [NAD(P)+]
LCIRRRFTVLDLAVRAGLLDECLEQIFGANGLWPITERELTGTGHAP